jgi:hypothetical protein
MTADLASPPPEAHAAATAPDTAPTTPLRTLRVTEQPLPRGLDGDWGPAPCDFARLYRGRVGEASVSVLLRRPDERSDVVTGRAHYDRTLGLAIDGKVDPKTGTFSLRETPGGTFEGRCDPATGALVGHHRLAGRKLPFSLEPRPAAWPGLHQLERTTERMPDPEVCRGRASRTRPVEVSLDPNDPDADTITCPPTERSAREAFFRDDPGARCEARDVGVRVFGLDDVTIEGRLNAELAAASGYALNVDELRDCPGRWSLESDATLLFADAHVIVTSGFSSRWYGAGAHPLNGGTGLVVLDRRSGRVLALEQVIRDVDALRDRVAACAPFFAAAATGSEVAMPAAGARAGCEDDAARGLLWGCEDGPASPAWALTGRGVLIGSWGHVHAMAALDGSGPILGFDVLLREGLLLEGSPVAGLWAGVAPAAATALPCAAATEGDVLRTWEAVP